MTEPFLQPISWTEASEQQLVAATRAALANAGIARIARFPSDAWRFINFLSMFGTPLRYYGDEVGTHPADAAIWRIKYDIAGAKRGDAHAVDGPLSVHSSQSLRMPRPRYFSMLMVNSGWQDRPAGENGESVLVRWSDAFKLMRMQMPTEYDALVDQLLKPVPFPGTNETRSVAYRLDSADHEFDLGIRLKGDLLEFLRPTAASHRAVHALECLASATRTVAHVVPLASGDLVLMDNDRWGHGREAVVGHVMREGKPLINPRELWSVTLG